MDRTKALAVLCTLPHHKDCNFLLPGSTGCNCGLNKLINDCLQGKSTLDVGSVLKIVVSLKHSEKCRWNSDDINIGSSIIGMCNCGKVSLQQELWRIKNT